MITYYYLTLVDRNKIASNRSYKGQTSLLTWCKKMNKKDINKNFSLIDKTQHQIGQWKKIQFLIDQLKLESFSFWFDRKRKYSWKGGRIN